LVLEKRREEHSDFQQGAEGTKPRGGVLTLIADVRRNNISMRIALTVLILFALAGCGRRVSSRYWEDGNYRVYTRPVSKEIIMGHYMGDGAVLGLCDPTVVSAGSDSRYIVFRREPPTGPIEYYYIEKKADGVGEVFGPYSSGTYESIAKRLSLPDFSWYLSRP
jgi:hypothetical protein